MTPLTPEEQRYAQTLAEAIAADVREHGPDEPLARAAIRWFEADDPLYFSIHVLSVEQRHDVAPEDAWCPLEWPDCDEQLERSERLGELAAVQQAGCALRARYEREPPPMGDEENWGAPSPAIVEAVRLLPQALRSAGLAPDAEFAASAAHFEGFGALAVLRAVASADLLRRLAARGELPEE